MGIKSSIYFLLLIFSISINANEINFERYLKQYQKLFLENHDNEGTHTLMKEIENNLSLLPTQPIITQLKIKEIFSEYSYYFGYLDKLKTHAESGIELSLKNNKEKIEYFYYYKAVYHNLNGDNIETVLENYQKTIKYSLLHENDEMLFSAYLELGELYSFINNAYKAFTYYQKAEQTAENETDYLHVILGISSLFYNLDMYDLAKEYLKKMEDGINKNEKLSIPKEDFYIYIYQVYTSIYLKQKNYQKAKEYFSKYLKVVDYMNDINFTARAYLEGVSLYVETNELATAKNYLDKSKKTIYENKEDILFGTRYNYYLSSYLYLNKNKEYKKAKNELLKIKEELIEEDKKGYEKISQMLSMVNKKLGNFKEALQDQKRFNDFYIQSRNKKENTLALFLSESYKEKELILNQKKLSNLNYEKEKKLLEINKDMIDKNNNLFLSTILIVTCIIFIGLLTYYYKIHKKISEKADLVDCYNRRFCVNQVNKLIKNKKNISLTLLDIDHFKTINDNYGHDVGDKILIEISELIKTKLNKSSFLCRIGGEEFLIIEKFDKKQSIDIEEIRKEIEENTFDNDKKVTSSFGNCVINKNEMTNFDKLYHKLDEKLYQAKNMGRNKVVY